MPIKIADHLPARIELEREGLFVMGEGDAIRQDIRPLRIALLNLMPNKQKTETQIARLIGATPLQIELTLITTTSYIPRNVSEQHMESFYTPWETVNSQRYDGLIITGAPVETLPFEEVKYWQELEQIYDWTQTHVHRTFNICWGAQAALYHFHRVPKHLLAAKCFGIFQHRILTTINPLLRGFSDEIRIPVSRHTETRWQDAAAIKGLESLIISEKAGLCLVEDKPKRQLYMFNHLEYDATTLADEYWRDRNQGQKIEIPYGYFPKDDPSLPPPNVWRSHAHLLFANWIHQIYQTTPFRVEEIGLKEHSLP